MQKQPTQEVIPSSQRNIKEEDATIAKVNAEGRTIYDDFCARQKNDKAFAGLDPQSKYEYYMKLYPDFARGTPVILRYITLGMFSEKANYLYFKQCYQYITKTDEDFCERQADFVRYVYHFNTKIRGAQLQKIWDDTKELLMKELEDIAKEREKLKAERLARQDENDAIRREALKVAVNRAITAAKEKLAAERVGGKIQDLERETKESDDAVTRLKESID